MTQPPSPAAATDLFGHDAAVGMIEQAMASSRLHHGWLIHGRQGIGKATLAYRFARTLLAGEEASAPGLTLAADYPVFQQVAGGHHPDLTVIEAERDQKTGKVKAAIPVDRVRTATASLHRTPAIAKRRVLIVDGAERLNRNAANALLKPLEEPPPGAVLILVSHRPGQVAATLRSRCVKLGLQGLDDATLLDRLSTYGLDLPTDRQRAIAVLAKGSLGRALALATSDWLATYERVLRTVGAARTKALDLDDLAAALAKQNAKEGFASITELLQMVLGRLIAQASDRTEHSLFDGEHDLLARLAARQPLDRWASLWEKIARLSAAVDGLNLDHTQALAQILAAMAFPPAPSLPFQSKAPSLGCTLLGGHHVVG